MKFLRFDMLDFEMLCCGLYSGVERHLVLQKLWNIVECRENFVLRFDFGIQGHVFLLKFHVMRCLGN